MMRRALAACARPALACGGAAPRRVGALAAPAAGAAPALDLACAGMPVLAPRSLADAPARRRGRGRHAAAAAPAADAASRRRQLGAPTAASAASSAIPSAASTRRSSSASTSASASTADSRAARPLAVRRRRSTRRQLRPAALVRLRRPGARHPRPASSRASAPTSPSEFRVDSGRRAGRPRRSPSVLLRDDDIENVLVRSGYAESAGLLRAAPGCGRSTCAPAASSSTASRSPTSTASRSATRPRPVSASSGSAQRVSLYGFGQDPTEPAAGASAASARRRPVRVEAHPAGPDRRHPRPRRASTTASSALAFRWSADILIRASARQLDCEFARQTLAVWARLSEVTTINVELDNRTDRRLDVRPLDAAAAPSSRATRAATSTWARRCRACSSTSAPAP